MKRQSTVVLLARLILVFFPLVAVAQDAMPPAVPEPFQFAAGTVNQRVTVVGRLELEGRNYFLDPRFVLVDDQNNRIPVTSWAPLELAPAPPGAPRPGSQGRTMQDYLHQHFSVVGIHRVIVGSPSQPGLLAAPGESYLEVQSVIDITTGTPIFNATSAMAPPNVGPDANVGSVTGPQPTEAQRPAAAAADFC